MAGLLDLAKKALTYRVEGYKNAPEQMGLLSMALPSPYGDVAGAAADAMGYAADPSSLTPGRGLLSLAALMPGIPAPALLKKGLKGDSGYMYHATNAERLMDIGESGALRTHKPWAFTEQDMWPDGATDMRSYFGESPENLWQFAPESGAPAVLRVKKDAAKFFRESTGDWFSKKAIKANLIEFLGEDGNWHQLGK